MERVLESLRRPLDEYVGTLFKIVFESDTLETSRSDEERTKRKICRWGPIQVAALLYAECALDVEYIASLHADFHRRRRPSAATRSASSAPTSPRPDEHVAPLLPT